MQKIDRLKTILEALRRVVVAYSGGLDSTFLLKAAVDALGRENVLAVTARSETYPRSEYEESCKLARKIGARHMAILTKELEISGFAANPINRCYYCKRELFKKLIQIKDRYGMNHIIDGTNLDDLRDTRHGRKAAVQMKVRSPLLEARLTKDDIRRFSKEAGLATWDKPSFACLASRFPFHTRITKKDLVRIGKAEECLRRLGFRQVRVRLHNKIARIELLKKDLAKAVRLGDLITKKMRQCGFIYAALDLGGYRTGSMHESA